MFERLPDLMQLTAAQIAFVAGAVLVAGMVRGFSGFALSALIMASVVLILPPLELIPICYVLEAVASLLMFRGGMRDADMKIVWGLAIGSAVGVPLGLFATTSLPVETSKLIALVIILVLSVTQLLRASPTFLATTPGLYASGVTAGVATGLAHVGGMVVALYVLARDAPVRTMRASLVMYLFIGMFTSIAFQVGFGVMNGLALTRGLVLAPVVAAGVLVGSFLFRPRLESTYKRFCLGLLIFLAVTGLARLVL